MRVVVMMLVRNEANRHLSRALMNVREILEHVDGDLIVTDDCSDDETPDICEGFATAVQRLPEPSFMRHEGWTRERHYRFASRYCRRGDWMLSLDADETLNLPSLVGVMAEQAAQAGCGSVGLPLYEFWEPDRYRVDGWWFGTRATRLFAWRDVSGPAIAQREMGCGSEPRYVQQMPVHFQDELHLLHWGYLDPTDRERKHRRYSLRTGGHGHNDAHVASILAEPTLRDYVWTPVG